MIYDKITLFQFAKYLNFLSRFTAYSNRELKFVTSHKMLFYCSYISDQFMARNWNTFSAFQWWTYGLEELCILTQNQKLCCQKLSWHIGAISQNRGMYFLCCKISNFLSWYFLHILNHATCYDSASIINNKKHTQCNIKLRLWIFKMWHCRFYAGFCS